MRNRRRLASSGVVALTLALGACSQSPAGPASSSAPTPVTSQAASPNTSADVSPDPSTPSSDGSSPRSETRESEAAQSAPPCYADQDGCDNPVKDVRADWKRLAYRAYECPPRKAYGDQPSAWDDATVDVHHHDFSGDGVDEVWVSFQCPASTTSWPAVAVVFDTRDDAGNPRVIDVLGKDARTFDGEFSARKNMLTITGPSSVDESNADHHHHVTLVYRWQGPKFELASKKETDDRAGAGAALADGSYYGYATAVEGGEGISIDVVEWFSGAAAKRACKDDKVSSGVDGALCNEYYIRNKNGRLRTLEVSPQAEISYLDDKGARVRLSPENVYDAFAVVGGGDQRLFTFRVRSGEVTSLTQVYLP